MTASHASSPLNLSGVHTAHCQTCSKLWMCMPYVHEYARSRYIWSLAIYMIARYISLIVRSIDISLVSLALYMIVRSLDLTIRSLYICARSLSLCMIARSLWLYRWSLSIPIYMTVRYRCLIDRYIYICSPAPAPSARSLAISLYVLARSLYLSIYIYSRSPSLC